MRSNRILPFIFLVAAIGVGYWMYNRYRVAPDIQEKNVHFVKDNQLTSLNESIGEDVAFVFYASWCGPCMLEMKDLTALHSEFEERGLRIVALTDDPPEKIELVRNKFGVPFEMYPLQGTLHDVGIYTIPTAYVFNDKGTLVFEQVDKWDWTNRAFLDQLFADLD